MIEKITNDILRCKTNIFDTVYRFVDKEQLIDIIMNYEIRPTYRADIIEKKALFVTPTKDTIFEVVQPYDYDGEEGYLLTIDSKNMIFISEGWSVEFEKEENIVGCYDFSWYTTEAIPITKVTCIEFIPEISEEK